MLGWRGHAGPRTSDGLDVEDVQHYQFGAAVGQSLRGAGDGGG
jgi:hypothetical protein